MTSGKNNRLLIGIICLSFVLRIIAIEKREIIYDDAFTILLSERNLGEIITGTAADTMPPLFYFILHFWMAVAQGLIWSRLLNIIIATSTIYVTYVWIKCISANEQAALFAGLLMAISPWHIYHAQDIRMYALLTLWLAGYAYFTSKACLSTGQNKISNWIGIVITGAGALYTHNLAIFTLLAPNLYLLLKKNWQNLKQLILLQIVAGMLFSPWLARVPAQFEKIQTAFWTPTPGLTEILQSLLFFTGSLPLPPLQLGIVLFLALLIFSYVILEGKNVTRISPNSYLLILFIIFPPLIIFFLSYIIRPIFVPRGFIFSSVAFYGFCGMVVVQLRSKRKQGLFLLLFFTSATMSLLHQIPFDEFPRSPYREGLKYLHQDMVDETIVVHDNKLSYLPMYYYDREINQVFVRDQPGTFNDTLAANTQVVMGIKSLNSIADISKTAKDVYYILFLRTEQEYLITETKNPNLTWLANNCLIQDTVLFNDLRILHYECLR